jgi:hypothetical protein
MRVLPLTLALKTIWSQFLTYLCHFDLRDAFSFPALLASATASTLVGRQRSPGSRNPERVESPHSQTFIFLQDSVPGLLALNRDLCASLVHVDAVALYLHMEMTITHTYITHKLIPYTYDGTY